MPITSFETCLPLRRVGSETLSLAYFRVPELINRISLDIQLLRVVLKMRSREVQSLEDSYYASDRDVRKPF